MHRGLSPKFRQVNLLTSSASRLLLGRTTTYLRYTLAFTPGLQQIQLDVFYQAQTARTGQECIRLNLPKSHVHKTSDQCWEGTTTTEIACCQNVKDFKICQIST